MTRSERHAGHDTRPVPGRRFAVGIGLVVVALAAAACSGGGGNASGATKAATASDTSSTVAVRLTAATCAPRPASAVAGSVEFDVKNEGAGAVSKAELRTQGLAHILGEVANLTPGLSGSFSVTLQPGSYVLSCPGATRSHVPFTVTGQATRATGLSQPQRQAAITGYASYINQNVAELVSNTQLFCNAITAGNLSEAQVLYPQARIYYERIKPVAEIWDDLDTEIDGRWENPVTDPSQFMGFHKLEQLLWADNTLSGAPPVCAGLMTHIAQLQSLVSTAQYNPLEMASGATDLLNEAAISKISGEEERYSNTDLIDLRANVDGAMEVFTLLEPDLQPVDPVLVTEIERRDVTLATVLATFEATPGFDQTGYVEYSQVPDDQRRPLAGALNALAESLSKMSGQVN